MKDFVRVFKSYFVWSLGLDFGFEEEFDTMPDVSQLTVGISALRSAHAGRFFGAKKEISTGVLKIIVLIYLY
jgi:hypothetical protein